MTDETLGEILEKGTRPLKDSSFTARRLNRESCAECGRSLDSELRIRLEDGTARCLRMSCQRCFGCEERLTKDDVAHALDMGKSPLWCADCRRRDRVALED